MAKKKPEVKKISVGTIKKVVPSTKKTTPKKGVVKATPDIKKISTKKIVVKPAKKQSKPVVKKQDKKGIAKPMTKIVVDRIMLPKNGKIFVKATKRPTAKKSSKNVK